MTTVGNRSPNDASALLQNSQKMDDENLALRAALKLREMEIQELKKDAGELRRLFHKD
jgi:hypothetical protein